MTYLSPERITVSHDVSGFECRSEEQTAWLRKYARQSDGAGTSRVFVVTPALGDEVVAYSAWCMASVRPEDAPGRLRKGAGLYPQPIALLTRLGVDIRHERMGLGAAMFTDMLHRLVDLSPQIGCRGLLIQCETDDARRFYKHLIPEFEPSPTDPLHLYLLMKDICKSLGR